MVIRAGLSALALFIALAPAKAQEGQFRRLQAYALMQTLNAALLASRSATFTLEKWCGDHGMAAEAKIVARKGEGPPKAISAEQRQRLAIGPDEPVKYRRVDLMCGAHVLSRADNWYVPARLTPEMNRLLEETNTPFGRAVQDLKPYRQTIAADLNWSPLPAGWDTRGETKAECEAPAPLLKAAMPEALFEHRAILYTQNQLPFSEVVETYQRDILDFPKGPLAP